MTACRKLAEAARDLCIAAPLHTLPPLRAVGEALLLLPTLVCLPLPGRCRLSVARTQALLPKWQSAKAALATHGGRRRHGWHCCRQSQAAPSGPHLWRTRRAQLAWQAQNWGASYRQVMTLASPALLCFHCVADTTCAPHAAGDGAARQHLAAVALPRKAGAMACSSSSESLSPSTPAAEDAAAAACPPIPAPARSRSCAYITLLTRQATSIDSLAGWCTHHGPFETCHVAVLPRLLRAGTAT